MKQNKQLSFHFVSRRTS